MLERLPVGAGDLKFRFALVAVAEMAEEVGSREAYLRHLITGEVPREAPPPEYFAFMREMHYVGHNLNQIAQKAHVLNVVDAKRYDEDSKRLDKLIREVTAAVVLPAKRE